MTEAPRDIRAGDILRLRPTAEITALLRKRGLEVIPAVTGPTVPNTIHLWQVRALVEP